MGEGGVNGRGRGQHVSGVAEGRQVAHVGHVTSQAGVTAEGRGLVVHAF